MPGSRAERFGQLLGSEATPIDAGALAGEAIAEAERANGERVSDGNSISAGEELVALREQVSTLLDRVTRLETELAALRDRHDKLAQRVGLRALSVPT